MQISAEETNKTCAPLAGARIGLLGAMLRQMRHAWPITLLLWISLCSIVALHTFVQEAERGCMILLVTHHAAPVGYPSIEMHMEPEGLLV